VLPKVECAVAVNLVLPRVERVEKDMDALHTAIRDIRALVTQHELSHRDAANRLEKLERAILDQHTDNQWTHSQIEGIQSAFREVREKIERIDQNVSRLDELRDDIKALFIDQSRSHEESIKRHSATMRTGMTIAYSIAGLIVVLAGLHAVASGESVVSSITRLLQWVSP
jgi:predicted  nucleic acid-binding Zn-ribbon protein